MSKEVKPEPCDMCPEDKKKECWSKWSICEEWQKWADGEVGKMNEKLKINPDFIKHEKIRILEDRVKRGARDLVRMADAMEMNIKGARTDYRLTMEGFLEDKYELKVLKGGKLTDIEKKILEKVRRLPI